VHSVIVAFAYIFKQSNILIYDVQNLHLTKKISHSFKKKKIIIK